MSSSANSSLRPAWHRGNQSGRGFQPPPTVASERGRSQSVGAADPGKQSVNKFAALDDDDDVGAAAAAAAAASIEKISLEKGAADQQSQPQPKNNPRSEALRSGLASAPAAKPPGRRLADLAARVPETEAPARGPRTTAGSRFSGLRGSETASGGGSTTNAANTAVGGKEEANVIRFTREKLISKRPPPNSSPPEVLKFLEGSPIVSTEPQDPVCWDTFDAEEIWAAQLARTNRALAAKAPGGLREEPLPVTDPRRLSTIRREPVAAGGRWQRGVALPPPGEAARKGRDKESEDPDDLWDDPVSSTGAAADFSAYGAIPDDPKEDSKNNGSGGDWNEEYDFEKIAEQTRKFEEELHGNRSRTPSEADLDELEKTHSTIKVDPKRPLATIGTTIRSGSGDDVNVFEDFDDPGSDPENGAHAPVVAAGDDPVAPNASDEAPRPKTPVEEAPTIKAADEDPSASSRLMAMIGVNKEPSLTSTPSTGEPKVLSAWGVPAVTTNPLERPLMKEPEGSVIPLNPWGGPLLPTPNPAQQGLDLQARLREAEMEQKAREAEIRRRQEQEEAQRRALQQEAEERARQAQAAAMQQQAGVQSQVELVLMERISTILENSWGRIDLLSILTTLHAEDSRVIPLLSTIDALRALLLRHPRRVDVRHDPAFGTEMASLLMSNTQWQEAQARAHQEEMHRRRMEEQQQKAAEAARLAQLQEAELRSSLNVVPNAPWFYSDPQRNIQGPFRGEEMRQWFEAGYFKGDLPISQYPSGPFHQLSLYFPDLSIAFLNPVDNSIAEEEARQRAEQEERERLEAEARQRAEREAKEAAERERRQQEEAARAAAERERLEIERLERERRQQEEAAAAWAAAERERLAREAEAAAAAQSARQESSNGGNESSAQLKLMLGLSAQGASVVSEKAIPQENTVSLPVQAPAPAPVEKRTKANKNAQKSTVKDLPQAAPVDTAEPQSPTKPTPTGSAWGGAAQPLTRKSMSEIQQEEARAAAILAMQRQGSRSTGSGWANVAQRGGSSAWQSGTVKPTTPAVVTGTTTLPTVTKVRSSSQSRADAQSGASQQHGGGTSTEDFGAKMSPALEKWCKDQMMKLNGSDDLTLASFCMTLDDPVEIRQYLTTYLGSTPQVNNFATEFINRKVGKQTSQQEEWETTGSAKKKSKNKKVGR